MIDNYIFQKEIKEKFSFQYKLLDICLFWWSFWISILKKILNSENKNVKPCLYNNWIFHLCFWNLFLFISHHYWLLTLWYMNTFEKCQMQYRNLLLHPKGLDFAIFIVTQLYMHIRAQASIEFFPHKTFDFLVEKFYC